MRKRDLGKSTSVAQGLMAAGPFRLLTWGIPLLGLVLISVIAADWWSTIDDRPTLGYVGRDRCIECHASQGARFAGSDHDRSMDRATPETVLADFNDVKLNHHEVPSRMFRKGDQFFVHTEGPDGTMADFAVKYVFGFEPLQQYLVELHRHDQRPHEEGGLQVLRWSWDTQQARWFHLDPPDVSDRLAVGDPLHWTGSGQNWNHMCASCHSTGLQKNFDVTTRQFHTTFSEIDVSCEACHGPGSLHVTLASATSLFWDRKYKYGLQKELRNGPAIAEIETCTPCHSRRRQIYPEDPPGPSYFDCYTNELLTAETYYPDGQIRDEVYEYGSFLQSKMFQKGVRCTDCHDPHTTQLKKPGNSLCTSCHEAHSAERFDTTAHHRHNPGSAGAQCVNCHMPETPFMDIDLRRDHSIRIPRPDLSVDLGTPNACTGCHLDPNRIPPETRIKLTHYSAWLRAAREGDDVVQAEVSRVDRWGADLYRQYYGDKYGRQDHFAYALKRAWEGDPEIATELARRVQDESSSAIVRATMLVELARLDPRQGWSVASQVLDESDPILQHAALAALENIPAATNGDQVRRYRRQQLELLTPLMQDPKRSLRIESARILADQSDVAFDTAERELRARGLDEYRRGLAYHGDQVMAHLELGNLAQRQRDLPHAIECWKTAIRIDPTVAGPRSNLAAALDDIGESKEANRLREEELPLLQRDAHLAPDSAGLQYRLGMALYLAGANSQSGGEIPPAFAGPSRNALEKACQLEPESEEFRLGLTLLLERLGDRQAAAASARRLRTIAPDNPAYGEIERRNEEP